MTAEGPHSAWVPLVWVCEKSPKFQAKYLEAGKNQDRSWKRCLHSGRKLGRSLPEDGLLGLGVQTTREMVQPVHIPGAKPVVLSSIPGTQGHGGGREFPPLGSSDLH